jgi:hypothetical protein
MIPAWENPNTRRKTRTIATFSTTDLTLSGCDRTQESAVSPETNGLTHCSPLMDNIYLKFI